MQVSMPGWIRGLIGSRKAWLILFGIALPVVNKKFNLEMTPEQVLAGMGSIATLVLSIAGEDAAGKWGSAREAAVAIQEAAKPIGFGVTPQNPSTPPATKPS